MPELIPSVSREEPGKHHFVDYVWLNVRSSVLLSWAIIVAVAILAYSGILVVLKNRQLHTSLKIAAETVHESLQAGDWALALGHLRSLEKSGHAFQITLKNKARGTDISGPFGAKPFGVGTLCAEENVDGQSSLSGCMHVLGTTEVYTLAFFLVFSGSVFLIALRFFQTKMRLFVKKVSDELEKIPALDPNREKTVGSGASGILEIDAIRTHIYELLTKIEKASASQALAQMSVQVAHDIRSPLAALEAAAGSVAQLPEGKRIMIRSAVGRIRDIANNLLDRHRAQADGAAPAAPEATSSQLLSSLIDPVVSEKRLQFRSQSRVLIELNLDPSSYGIFAAVQPIEFKRLVSNLVNNAVESFGDSAGTVSVGLSSRDGRALVSVEDDGKGIPPEVLAKLGGRGETHGKAGGSGLGLYHARTSAESWCGSLDLASELGKGTTATLTLPLAPAPEWFVSEMALVPGRAVVILDDDASIHQVWQERLEALKASKHGVLVVHVSTPDEIRNWVKNEADAAREALFLFDYELLGHHETGLSLAAELGLGERMVLVTSRYAEPDILEGCRRLKARLLPKGLASSMPMRIASSSAPENKDGQRLDAVLIDDDALTRMIWENAASDTGKRLRTFSTVAEFFMAAGEIDHATPVYVDSNLGEGVEGAAESMRVHELGFGEIYLATGHEPGRFAQLKHLRGVIGKDPPWDV